MVATSASEAVANANAYSSCEPGMCLKYTRTWLEIPSYYGSASDAWDGALFRHEGDRNPPAGAPVFYRGGQHGHVALSVGGGKVRTTDRPSSGKVSTVPLADIEHAWGYPYEGWTEDLNGVSIPWLYAPGEDGEDMAVIENISPNACANIASAIWTRYVPGGKNLATWLGDIGGNVAYIADSLGKVAAALGVELDAPPEPVAAVAEPDDD